MALRMIPWEIQVENYFESEKFEDGIILLEHMAERESLELKSVSSNIFKSRISLSFITLKQLSEPWRDAIL